MARSGGEVRSVEKKKGEMEKDDDNDEEEEAEHNKNWQDLYTN